MGNKFVQGLYYHSEASIWLVYQEKGGLKSFSFLFLGLVHFSAIGFALLSQVWPVPFCLQINRLQKKRVGESLLSDLKSICCWKFFSIGEIFLQSSTYLQFAVTVVPDGGTVQGTG